MAHCLTQTDPFEVHLPPSPDVVPDLRQAFEQWLRSPEIDTETTDELSVVLSELVTNGIQASQGAAQEVEVAAWIEDDKIVLCVANPITQSSARVTTHDLDDPIRTGGRGLVIVRAFTDAMSIEFDNGYIVVRCERSLHD